MIYIYIDLRFRPWLPFQIIRIFVWRVGHMLVVYVGHGFHQMYPQHISKKGIMWETLASLDQANLGSFHAANRIRGTTLVIEKFQKWYELAGSGCLFSWKFRIFIYILENMEPQNDDVVPKKTSSKGFMFKFEVNLMFFVAWKRSHEVFWICF